MIRPLQTWTSKADIPVQCLSSADKMLFVIENKVYFVGLAVSTSNTHTDYMKVGAKRLLRSEILLASGKIVWIWGTVREGECEGDFFLFESPKKSSVLSKGGGWGRWGEARRFWQERKVTEAASAPCRARSTKPIPHLTSLWHISPPVWGAQGGAQGTSRAATQDFSAEAARIESHRYWIPGKKTLNVFKEKHQ